MTDLGRVCVCVLPPGEFCNRPATTYYQLISDFGVIADLMGRCDFHPYPDLQGTFWHIHAVLTPDQALVLAIQSM